MSKAKHGMHGHHNSMLGKRIQPPDPVVPRQYAARLTAEQIEWIRLLPADASPRAAKVQFFRKFQRDVSDTTIRNHRGNHRVADS